ncbi:P-loop NTPase [Deinococcus sp. YIM 134068]|uniref:P-loop NTPase n=1 Tax=Deinococcus lichenicola TaxID=3118910 RepID=UPI002F93AFBC
MSPIPLPTDPGPAEDADFRRFLATLRRGALVIAGGTVLAGGAAFLLASRQAPVYEARTSLITVPGDGGGGTALRESVFAAPPLPRGALEDALQSREVLGGVLAAVGTSGLPPATVQSLTREVDRQLAGTSSSSALSVTARGNSPQDGVYEVRGRAATPQGASALADAGASALLGWDAERARRRLSALRDPLERQFTALDERLGTLPAPATRRARLERQTLEAARAQVLRNLAQVTALGQSTVGTLDRVAVDGAAGAGSVRQISPRPLRSALIAAAVALLLLAGAALLLDRTRRRIYDAGDLRGWGVPLLGRLPTLRGAARTPQTAAAGPWRDPVGFLRVNLTSQLGSLPGAGAAPGTGGPRRVVVASPGGGEGRSLVTAALASSLAAGGERVLVVDADTRGTGQAGLWSISPASGEARPSAPISPVAVTVAGGVDLLPAASLRGADGGLDHARLAAWLGERAGAYDTILLDTPPLLTSPDAVTLAARAGGLVLVVVPGATGSREVEAALGAARTAGARVLGFVLNARPGTVGTSGRVAQRAQTRDLVPGEAAVR